MKKIGFIDYYLDEWHANKYPEWIESATGGRMKVAYAYGKKDAEHGLSNADWCRSKGIEPLGSIREVVEKSDCLIVLSPDHPELHEELAALPLSSGKPTYVDKTFAPDRETALRLFETAAKHGTPLYSSSALRFADEYAAADKSGIESILSVGPGPYGNYSIHQFEPIVSLMGTGAERIMYTGTDRAASLLVGFSGGRSASVHLIADSPFGLTLSYASGQSASLKAESDFFASFIRNMTQFFETGTPTVDPAETIAIVTLVEYGRKAALTPFEWLALPQGD